MSVAETKVTSSARPLGAAAEPERPQGAPARSRAETRRRLTAAATELFASEGLHGVTSARIARRAGVATGTFYLHFSDKKELFREIAFAALAELRERQSRAGRDARDTSAELRARTEELLRFAEEQRSLVRVLFGREQEASYVGEDVLDHIVAGIETRLRERVAAGELPESIHPAVAAQAIAGMTARVVAWWVEDPSRSPREQVIETILRMHPIYAGPSDG
jgi:AcrR family transcriptional regulator